MGYPAPLGRRTLRRVARAAQHLRVGDVERRTASGERYDVIDGQVRGTVGGAAVARAPVAVLATPGAEHPGAEPLPDPRAVDGVVPAAIGLASVLGAAATNAAGDDTADRAQRHARIVGGRAGAVYSPGVLDPRSHDRPQITSRCGWGATPARRVSRRVVLTRLGRLARSSAPSTGGDRCGDRRDLRVGVLDVALAPGGMLRRVDCPDHRAIAVDVGRGRRPVRVRPVGVVALLHRGRLGIGGLVEAGEDRRLPAPTSAPRRVAIGLVGQQSRDGPHFTPRQTADASSPSSAQIAPRTGRRTP